MGKTSRAVHPNMLFTEGGLHIWLCILINTKRMLCLEVPMSDASIAWHFDGETPDRKRWLMCTWIKNWSEISIIWHTTQLSKCCSAATGTDLNSQF